MKYLLLIILCISSCCSYSAIYMQTDQNGNVSYKDSPSNNATQIDSVSTDTPEAPISKKTSTPEELTNTPVVKRKPYTDFSIKDPVDQQTFQNQHDITVQLYVRPLLQKDDQIQLYVDGVPSGEPLAQTSLTLHQVDRGTHRLNAVLLSKDLGILKQSESIVIYVHYARVAQPS